MKGILVTIIILIIVIFMTIGFIKYVRNIKKLIISKKAFEMDTESKINDLISGFIKYILFVVAAVICAIDSLFGII